MKACYLSFLIPLFLIPASCEKLEQEKVIDGLCSDPNSLFVMAGDTDPKKPCLIAQKERKALILYFMSTDCLGCGSWGSEMFHRILEENTNTTEGLQIHIRYTDPWIIKDFSDPLMERYAPQFTPFIMVENRVPSGVGPIQADPNILLPKAKLWIEELVAETPEIAPAVAFRIVGNKVKLYYGGQFQNDVQGEYSFGLYLMEDSLEYNQAGSIMRPYFHNNTVRTTINGAWGIELQTGVHSKGETFVGETETDLIGYWKTEDLHLLGVVWKKDAEGKMQVINTVHSN